MIELPITLRAPLLNELPNRPELIERLEKLKTANIVEGYSKQYRTDTNVLYNFYCEININNSRLWDLVFSLSSELPDVSALIFGHIDFEPIFGKYINKDHLLNELVEFKNELIQDTYIEWGLIYCDKEKVSEIFITDSKYIKFWGVNEEAFDSIMNNFGLQEIDNLEFVDEYPKVREPLILFDSTVLNSEELIHKLEAKYAEK